MWNSVQEKKVFGGIISACLIMLMLGSLWSLSRAQTAVTSGATQRSLPRQHDVIRVSGKQLSRFEGVPIKQLSLLALKDGKLSSIPFQVDERDRKGHYIMTSGKRAGKDEDGGKLDANDELVFLGMDTGDRLSESEQLAGGSRAEITLTDPRYPNHRAWAYLGKYDSAAPRSNVDYVRYDSSTEQIISKYATVGYKKGFMFYNNLSYPKSAGGNDEDFLDRIKFRFMVDFLGGKAKLVRNEDCVTAEVAGWIDGPVRVIQLTENSVKLFENLPSIRFDGLSEYYPHMMSTPINIRFPFEMSKVAKILGIRTISATIIGDLAGLVGGKAYTNQGLAGYTYTGNATEENMKKIDREGIVWGMATKAGVGTWFPRLVFPDVMYQYNWFYFTDNLTLNNPPDDIPGEIGAGVTLDLLNSPPEVTKWLGTESFTLKFETYYAKPGATPADARKWLDILDYPLFVDVYGGDAPQTGTSGKSASAGPPWKKGCDGVITETRGRKIELKKIAYFIGGVEASARNYFLGERVTDQTFYNIPLNKIRSISNHYVDYEPVTKTQFAMFTEVVLTDGAKLDLLSCKMCGWGGSDDEGRVIYLSNTQTERIEFSPSK